MLNRVYMELHSEQNIRSREYDLFLLKDDGNGIQTATISWVPANTAVAGNPTVSLPYDAIEKFVERLPEAAKGKRDTEALAQQYQHRIAALEIHIADLRRLLHHQLGIQV